MVNEFEDGDSVVHAHSGRLGEVVSVREGRVPIVEVAWTDDGQIQRLPADLIRKDDRLAYQAPPSTARRKRVPLSREQWKKRSTPKPQQRVMYNPVPSREPTGDPFKGEKRPRDRTPGDWYALLPHLAHWAWKRKSR